MAAVPFDAYCRADAGGVLTSPRAPLRQRRLKPLVWPVALLIIGAAASWLAEFAVGRWQDYGLYGLARPVADLLLIIGAVWLGLAVIGVVRGRRG